MVPDSADVNSAVLPFLEGFSIGDLDQVVQVCREYRGPLVSRS